MNGNVIHMGGLDFTLTTGILSNETSTKRVPLATTPRTSYIFNTYGAYNKVKMEIENSPHSLSNSGGTTYEYVFEGNYTFTLPINLIGNYNIEVTANDDQFNEIVSYGGNPTKYSINVDINGNILTIPFTHRIYTRQTTNVSAYLRLIKLVKN